MSPVAPSGRGSIRDRIQVGFERPIARIKHSPVGERLAHGKSALLERHDELGHRAGIGAFLEVPVLLRLPKVMLSAGNPVVEHRLRPLADRRVDGGHLLGEVIERAPEPHVLVWPGLESLLEALKDALHRVLVGGQRLDPPIEDALADDLVDDRVGDVVLGRKVMKEGADGEPRLVGDLADAHGVKTPAVNLHEGDFEDVGAGFSGIAGLFHNLCHPFTTYHSICTMDS